MELLEIKSDVLGVIERIYAWNNKYRVFYNTKIKKYILYLIENDMKPLTYCLTFPYQEIDERMLELVQKSEVQNRKAYLEEIEKSNALLLKREQKNCLAKMEAQYENKRNN